jgi:hypothetical protein
VRERTPRGAFVGSRRTFNPASIPIHDDRLQKLVRLVLRIPRLDSRDIVPTLRSLALPMHEPVDRDLHALPALIAVHRIVSPHDGRDFPNAELLNERPQLARIARRGARSRITAVAEEMHVYVRHADLLRGLEQRVQVRVMRVDTAVRDLAPGADSVSLKRRHREGESERTRPRRCSRPLVSLA